MADAFLSQHWYRVAKLKPALRSHVRVHRHRYRGNAWYVIEDKVSGKTHRLTPAAYSFVGRLDGTRAVEDIWTQVAAKLDENAPTQDDVIGLLSQLHSADLIQSETPPDTAELLQRHRKQSNTLWRQNLTNPLSFRVPLFDPTRFLEATLPFVRPLLGIGGLLLWVAIVIPAVLLAGANWTELTENISDRVLSFDGITMMLLTYPLVKALHELGHGYFVKVNGGEVREIGLMFLIFFPVPYVDASAAAAFPSKYQRMAVGAAGILVEVLLAALAMFAWAVLEPGFLRAVMFNIMVIAGVSTVLVNGNPLLRFDGYFVLADLLEIPNLGTRANRYLAYIVEKYAFGIEQTKPYVATPGERAVFLAYAPLAFVYRILLAAGIAIFVAQQYFVVGVMIALWSMTQALLKPVWKGIWHIFAASKLRAKRNRVMLVTGGVAAVVLFFLLAIPMPLHTLGEGVVWLPESGYVRAGTQGFIKELAAVPGARVAAGQDLVVLEEPVLDARIRSLGWRVRELEIKLAQHKVTDRVLAEVTKIELEKAQDEYERERVRIGRLVAQSRAAGRFIPAAPAPDLPGRYVKEGDLLGYVLPDEASVVRVVVTQASIDLVRDRLRGIELKPAERLDETRTSSVARYVPAGLFSLPSPALGLPGGGEIAVDPRDKDARTTLARVFQFDLEVPAESADAWFGGRVYVKFIHQMEPVGFQIYRWARQLFLTQFNV